MIENALNYHRALNTITCEASRVVTMGLAVHEVAYKQRSVQQFIVVSGRSLQLSHFHGTPYLACNATQR